MKLHITPEQFRELPEEGQEFLREYARKKSHEKDEAYLVFGESKTPDGQVYIVQVQAPKNVNDMHMGYAVCFNIGQMIEFLRENEKSEYFCIDNDKPLEPADTLWEEIKDTVKRILEKNG